MNCIANTLLVPISGYVVERRQLKSSTSVSISGLSMVNNASSLFTLVRLCVRTDCFRVLHASIGTAEIYRNVESHDLRKVDSHLLKEVSSTENTEVDDCPNLTKNLDSKHNREMERRRKIGLANRGKVPWNKGRKHSAGNSYCNLFLRQTFELPKF